MQGREVHLRAAGVAHAPGRSAGGGEPGGGGSSNEGIPRIPGIGDLIGVPFGLRGMLNHESVLGTAFGTTLVIIGGGAEGLGSAWG